MEKFNQIVVKGINQKQNKNRKIIEDYKGDYSMQKTLLEQ